MRQVLVDRDYDLPPWYPRLSCRCWRRVVVSYVCRSCVCVFVLFQESAEGGSEDSEEDAVLEDSVNGDEEWQQALSVRGLGYSVSKAELASLIHQGARAILQTQVCISTMHCGIAPINVVQENRFCNDWDVGQEVVQMCRGRERQMWIYGVLSVEQNFVLTLLLWLGICGVAYNFMLQSSFVRGVYSFVRGVCIKKKKKMHLHCVAL